MCTRLLHTPPFNPHSCFRSPATDQQRGTGHISLKQTVHLRAQSEVPAFLRSNASKESTNSAFLPSFHQRSNSENGATYITFSPYALRRKEISRPFSPPTTNDVDAVEPPISVQRPYSPFKQYFEQNKDYSTNRCSANGQGRQETRPFSPYRPESNPIEPSARPYSPYHGRFEEQRDSSKERWQNAPRSISPFARDYSPWRRENVDPPGVIQPLPQPPPPPTDSGRFSPFLQQRLGQTPPVPQTHPQTQDIYGSPMINRKRFPSEPPSQGTHGTTSPELLISRFEHQLKQDSPPGMPPTQGGSKDSAKKRFASYVRLRLGSDRAPSPEPPPRLNRGESPLAIRRNVVEQASPSFPRRYVSPSPPQPPPRRLSESNSVPGSPQHVRARLRYTPEPQRRPPPPP